MNARINIIKVADYPSDNLQTVEFSLNGLEYLATRRYDKTGNTTECQYGRIIANYYYDTKETIFEGTINGMCNAQPVVHLTEITDEEFEKLIALKK